MATERAYITPTVIKWARETARYNIDQAAQKIGVNPMKLESWESGEAYPTLNQAMKMSRVYCRSLSVFFLPDPPEDFQTLRDFRKQNQRQQYSSELTFILREVQSRHEWLKDFLIEEEEESLPFVGKFSKDDDYKDIAYDIVHQLNISDDHKKDNRLKYWINKSEENRIFISLASNYHSRMVFSVEEFRGFAISDDIAPVIFINSKDAQQAQLFTLVHELAHIWINESGISRDIYPENEEQKDNGLDSIEVLCNRVAAHILMPDKIIEKKILHEGELNFSAIQKIAKSLQVSSKAILVRLKEKEELNNNQFYGLWDAIEQRNQEWLKIQEERKKKQKGHPDPNYLQYRKCGESFTNIVLSSYKNGRISGSEASRLLDVKLERFPKIERYIQI